MRFIVTGNDICRKTAAVVAVAAAAVLSVQAQAPAGTDVLARLSARLSSGEATLAFDDQRGYLPSLLEQLGISVDSQVLVFSKTSFQHALITPQNPRAVYFNDAVSIGMVPGGSVYEMMALEPERGLAFYSLDTAKTERPVFQRRGVECLFCHGPGNKGAAAMVVASVIPNAAGVPAYTSAFIDTIDHRTPFERRWGGWYVTGTHGPLTHMGNAVAPDPEHPLDLEQSHSQNVTSLAGRFDVSKYLTGTSDIVALMTLEHQVGATNRLGALGVQYRAAQRTGTVDLLRDLEPAVRDLVDYMLFVDAAPISAPVNGVSSFTRTFAARGPRDSRGRSLREFDLRTKLFRYPVSYTIYSELFDTLPQPIRERVYQRMYDVLSGKDASTQYDRLSADDRKAGLEIVAATKANVPAYWASSQQAGLSEHASRP
jgi:hypothetical protein